MKNTILVNTYAQKVLLEGELFGQFSDGFWENSRNKSWRFWSDCDVVVSDELGWKSGERWATPKAYAVNNTELLSYVGQRMLGMARFAYHYQTELDGYETSIIESLAGCGSADKEIVVTEADIDENYNYYKERYDVKDANPYYKNYMDAYERFIAKYGKEGIIRALNDTRYGKKEMRKDLRGIHTALKTRISAEAVA